MQTILKLPTTRSYSSDPPRRPYSTPNLFPAIHPLHFIFIFNTISIYFLLYNLPPRIVARHDVFHDIYTIPVHLAFVIEQKKKPLQNPTLFRSEHACAQLPPHTTWERFSQSSLYKLGSSVLPFLLTHHHLLIVAFTCHLLPFSEQLMPFTTYFIHSYQFVTYNALFLLLQSSFTHLRFLYSLYHVLNFPTFSLSYPIPIEQRT